jgi:ABC-2 type transport system ATP-binding protein
MPLILETRELKKEFQIPIKPEGLWGSIKSLIRPQYRSSVAVKDVTFQVEAGELLAFIGPNGAGKSTTIKMLSGILYPSSGSASVLGKNPWEDREELAFSIGSVFGQKSQLWLHLPPADTFRLLGKIYEIPDPVFAERLGKMVEMFDLKDLLTVPVRKLSLGQRMRCEIAAALLHRPRLIFLDEPTIGLDVIAKEKIRELILTANREEGVTIFLTSHDAGDIEKLCRRVIIIDHGALLLDANVQALRRSPHFSIRTIGVKLSKSADSFSCPRVEILKRKGSGLKLRFDRNDITAEEVIDKIREYSSIEDITIRNPSLDEIIGHIYRCRGFPVDSPSPEEVDADE